MASVQVKQNKKIKVPQIKTSEIGKITMQHGSFDLVIRYDSNSLSLESILTTILQYIEDINSQRPGLLTAGSAGGSDVQSAVAAGGSDVQSAVAAGGSDVQSAVAAGGSDVQSAVAAGGSNVGSAVAVAAKRKPLMIAVKGPAAAAARKAAKSAERKKKKNATHALDKKTTKLSFVLVPKEDKNGLVHIDEFVRAFNSTHPTLLIGERDALYKLFKFLLNQKVEIELTSQQKTQNVKAQV